MSIYSEQDAKAILEKVVKLSKADECTATPTAIAASATRLRLSNVS